VASASMLMRHLSCMDVPSLAFMITCRKHDTASQQGACGLQQTSSAASQCSKGYNPSVVKGCGPGVVKGYGCCHHGSCRACIMHPTPSHKQSPSTACVKSWSAGNRLCKSHYDSGQSLLPYQDRTFFTTSGASGSKAASLCSAWSCTSAHQSQECNSCYCHYPTL